MLAPLNMMLLLPSPEARVAALRFILLLLTPSQFSNLRYLTHFLKMVAARSSHNKMTPANLVVVFVPTLVFSQGMDPLQQLGQLKPLYAVIPMLIEYHSTPRHSPRTVLYQPHRRHWGILSLLPFPLL